MHDPHSIREAGSRGRRFRKFYVDFVEWLVLKKCAMTKAWRGGMAVWLDHNGVAELRVSLGLLFGRLLNAGE